MMSCDITRRTTLRHKVVLLDELLSEATPV